MSVKKPSREVSGDGSSSPTIGVRIRGLRQQKGFTQAQLEAATGLQRSYISRVECGRTAPSIETLKKFAASLDVSLSHLFHSGDDAPSTSGSNSGRTLEQLARKPGKAGAEARFVLELRRLAGRLDNRGRRILLELAGRMAK